METRDVLTDAFDRIRELVEASVDGLDAEQLAWRPDPGANSIAWLVWHLTRIQDDHVAELAGAEQKWTQDGWAQRFGRPADPGDTGFVHTAEQVAAIRPDGPDVLRDYHADVAGRTRDYLATIDAEMLDEIVDASYDPPVSVGVRLVSVISDNLQHAGQARYLRGMLDRHVAGAP